MSAAAEFLVRDDDGSGEGVPVTVTRLEDGSVNVRETAVVGVSVNLRLDSFGRVLVNGADEELDDALFWSILAIFDFAEGDPLMRGDQGPVGVGEYAVMGP